MDTEQIEKIEKKERRKDFISGLVRDEDGRPSSTKIQSWLSWIIVVITWVVSVILTGFADSMSFALALLGVGTVNRSVSKVSTLRFGNTSNGPTKTLFKSRMNNDE